MKTSFLSSTLALALFAGTATYAAEKLKLTEVPDPVQKTIIAERGAQAEVKGITINAKKKDGQIVYDVTFKEPGKNPKLRIAADGTVIKETGKKRSDNSVVVTESAGAKVDATSPKFNELPQAVQTTINKEKGEATVEAINIHTETKDKQTVYRVEFKEKGKNTKLWVNEAGAIIKDNRTK